MSLSGRICNEYVTVASRPHRRADRRQLKPSSPWRVIPESSRNNLSRALSLSLSLRVTMRVDFKNSVHMTPGGTLAVVTALARWQHGGGGGQKSFRHLPVGEIYPSSSSSRGGRTGGRLAPAWAHVRGGNARGTYLRVNPPSCRLPPGTPNDHHHTKPPPPDNADQCSDMRPRDIGIISGSVAAPLRPEIRYVVDRTIADATSVNGQSSDNYRHCYNNATD